MTVKDKEPQQEVDVNSQSSSTSSKECEMCSFLHAAKQEAKSKQANAEYAEAFYNHVVKFHPRNEAR